MYLSVFVEDPFKVVETSHDTFSIFYHSFFPLMFLLMLLLILLQFDDFRECYAQATAAQARLKSTMVK
jgi:hypothetical protein